MTSIQPLNQQKVPLTPGQKNEEISALDPRRIRKLDILPYHAYPGETDPARCQEWIEVIGLIENDLHTLLSLPHDLFWCQVIFDESVSRCVESFLQFAPRKYDVSVKTLKDDIKQRLAGLYRLVFMVCLRMSTHKESKENFLEPSVFGDIIYENYLFDIPKIIDICVIYGEDNLALVSKMVANIFTQQVKYWDDLTITIGTIEQIFESILQTCGIHQHPDNDTPRQLAQHSPNSAAHISNLPNDKLVDVVAYICDVGVTLSTFLAVFTPACQRFLEHGFPLKLAFFYDSVMHIVKSELKTRKCNISARHQLHIGKKNLLSCFHHVIHASCIAPILYQTVPMDTARLIDSFLDTFSDIIEYRRFIADYEAYHPFKDLIDLFSQATSDLDSTRITYIQDAINHAFASYGRRKKPTGHQHTGGRGSPDGQESEVNDDTAAASIPKSCTVGEGACALEPSYAQKESLISLVRDMLPDYTDMFIEACLEHYQNDAEKTINAILENKVPEHVQSSAVASLSEAESVLSDRRNIYDNDEFDVFRREDIDFNRIHQGKRDDSSTSAILNNKDFLQQTRAIYDFYGSNDVDSAYGKFDEYDDEYDDTYDDTAVAAADQDTTDDITSKKKHSSRDHVTLNQQEKDDSSSEDETEKVQKTQHFLTDPAVLRRQAEERRASKLGLRTGSNWKKVDQSKSNGNQLDSKSSKTYDVKGKPRGQGQTSNVLKNRQYKEQNKSMKANHNRKNMADKKRAKGMGPLS